MLLFYGIFGHLLAPRDSHMYTHMPPYMFTHVFMIVWLGLVAYWSTLGVLGVKSYCDTCMHSHGLQGLTNFSQCIINMYHTHIQDVLSHIMIIY